MVIRIERLSGDFLSKACRKVSPSRYEIIQQKNKLLDGTYHIQTIGTPLKYKDFIVVATEPQVEIINLMESQGESIKLIEYEKYFIGLISDRIEWERLTTGYRDREQRLYEAKVSIIVKEEGDVE